MIEIEPATVKRDTWSRLRGFNIAYRKKGIILKVTLGVRGRWSSPD